NGHVQYLGKLYEPAGADPVEAALVLLYLLESKRHRVAQRRLAHAEERPTLTHAGSNVYVHWMKRHRPFLGSSAGKMLSATGDQLLEDWCCSTSGGRTQPRELD